MPSPNARGSLRERVDDGQFFWIVLLVGVGLNSSGNLDKDFSCWELVLLKEVRLLGG